MSSSFALKIGDRVLTQELPRETWLWALLLASYFFFLGFPRLFTIPGYVLVLVGAWQLWIMARNGWRGISEPNRWVFVIFGLYWIPLLLSLVDAQSLPLSVGPTFRLLIYGFIAFSCIWLARERNVIQPFLVCLLLLAVFWALDAILQKTAGVDVFGKAYVEEGHRASAYFKVRDKFGFYMGYVGLLAVYAATVLGLKRGALVFVWGVVFVGLILGACREAWLSFMLFAAPLLWYSVLRHLRYPKVSALAAVILFCAVAYLVYRLDPGLQARMHQTLVTQFNYDALNRASSWRLDLWRASLDMFSTHWANGLGLDAFNENFANYPSADFWRNLKPAHEHQYILQIANAGGVIALAGLVAIIVILFRLWMSSAADKKNLLPIAVYLGAMWFPLNTHYSFYSSEMVMVNWMMVGLLLGGLFPKEHEVNKPL